MPKVLVVDDQDSIRHFVAKAMEEEGHDVCAAPSGEEALGLFSADPPDAVILDLKLPGMNGMDVLEKIKQINKETIVIMITAYGEISSAVKAIKKGAFDYIPKPLDIDHLILTLNRALKSKRLWLSSQRRKKRRRPHLRPPHRAKRRDRIRPNAI